MAYYDVLHLFSDLRWKAFHLKFAVDSSPPYTGFRVHLVPFVQSQSYNQIRVHLDPNIHHLAGYPLGLPQGPLGVPGPHFENRGSRSVVLKLLNSEVFS